MDYGADRIDTHTDPKARCVQCNSPDVDDAGICRVCGFATRGAAAGDAESRVPLRHAGAIPIEPSMSTDDEKPDQTELPEWRKELSRRLKEIKQKREAGDYLSSPADPESAAMPEPIGRDHAGQGQDTSPEPVIPATTGREAAVDGGSPDDGHREDARTGEPPESEEPPDRTAQTVPETAVSHQSAGRDKTVDDLRSLIDKVVRKPEASEKSLEGTEEFPAESLDYYYLGSEPHHDKLVLLTRTVAGLVDLLIVVLIGSAMIFAVDIVEGIEIFDRISVLYYLALLLVTFLTYSVFFLSTANQTIGMMITDLRLMRVGNKRPELGPVVVRCLAYLGALGAFGIGLFWGLFDSRSRCLHDIASGTQVTRLLPY